MTLTNSILMSTEKQEQAPRERFSSTVRGMHSPTPKIGPLYAKRTFRITSENQYTSSITSSPLTSFRAYAIYTARYLLLLMQK